MTRADLDDLFAAEQLPESYQDTVAQVLEPLADLIEAEWRARQAPIFIGLCGPQGSGKTTAVRVLRRLLETRGRRTADLSLDDLYLTRAERRALAAKAHPLLATRGPPGTHDVDLGMDILARLRAPGFVTVPRFDKARDDRAPKSEWNRVQGPADIVFFEGWCVGAVPQAVAALDEPLNALEREEDADGVWRRFVNAALAGYQRLFREVDRLVLLAPPSFEVVVGWRIEQEQKLRARQPSGAAVMTDAEVRRFVAHYERLTRHILVEMPGRADVVIRLGADRRPEPLAR
jgi:D-glycerate 3-kinase